MRARRRAAYYSNRSRWQAAALCPLCFPLCLAPLAVREVRRSPSLVVLRACAFSSAGGRAAGLWHPTAAGCGFIPVSRFFFTSQQLRSRQGRTTVERLVARSSWTLLVGLRRRAASCSRCSS